MSLELAKEITRTLLRPKARDKDFVLALEGKFVCGHPAPPVAVDGDVLPKSVAMQTVVVELKEYSSGRAHGDRRVWIGLCDCGKVYWRPS